MNATVADDAHDQRDRKADAGASQTPSPRSGWIRTVLGSLAAITALLFALGYLESLAHSKMLGIGAVDLPNEKIIHRAVGLPLLSVLCALLAMGTWGGCVLAVALLLIYLRPGVYGWLGRCRWRRVRAVCLRMDRCLARRWVRGAGPWAALGVVVAVSLLAFVITAKILKQGDQLLVISSNDCSTNTDRETTSLLGYDLDLTALLAKDNERRALYGFLFLAALFCTVGWLHLWRRFARDWPARSARQRFAKGSLIATGCVLLMQLAQVPMLYGYLAPENEFPAIKVVGADSPRSGQAGKPSEGEQSGAHEPPDFADALRGKLLILGSRGDVALVYSMKTSKLWWVKQDKLLPAIQLEPVNPFQPQGRQTDDQK